MSQLVFMMGEFAAQLPHRSPLLHEPHVGPDHTVS